MRQCLSYLPKFGEGIKGTIDGAVKLAEERKAAVRTILGGRPFTVNPGDTRTKIASDYYRMIQKSRRRVRSRLAL